MKPFNSLPLVLTELPEVVLHTFTGNMLGDGSLQVKSVSYEGKGKNLVCKRTGGAYFNIGQKADNRVYVDHLHSVYTLFTPSTPRGQNDPKVIGRIKSWQFTTRMHPALSISHDLWYKWDPQAEYRGKVGRFIKVVPQDINLMFSTRSLAYWIMDDGFYKEDEAVTVLSTNAFSYKDCELLVEVIASLGIKAGINSVGPNQGYHIRISSTSMDLLRELVKPYMLDIFLYKIGVK